MLKKLALIRLKWKYRIAAGMLMLADAVTLLASVVIASLIRFDNLPLDHIYQRFLQAHIPSLLVGVGFYLCVYHMFRLYRYAWRYASLEMLRGLFCANTIGLVGLVLIQTLIDGSVLPRSILALLWVLSTLATGAVRLCLRMMHARRRRSHHLSECKPAAQSRRVVIVGGEAHGARVLRAIREDLGHNYRVVGLLDDNPNRHGLYIGDVRVLGPISYLKQMISKGEVDEVIIASPEESGTRMKEYVLRCRRQGITVKVVPPIHDILDAKTSIHLEDFSVEDLLRRPPVRTDMETIAGYISGKRVLVTGAGGSIGSELCRQIIARNPASLVLLGHGENSVHGIYQELTSGFRKHVEQLHCVIASVANADRLDQVLSTYQPDIVFHAAAHKHVPLMELNEQEAVYNNVIGTGRLADACGRHGVERFVLISTDKAADACSVMGATKWLCEETVRAFSTIWTQTRYVTVRFGNVLGSRGSVVPIFREQIRRGGPLTVTHPEMTRYFMTIPEAVRLVLQAGAVGTSGDLFLLDMGQPVKIVDLAEDMIRLCGLDPGLDIEIEFCGLRPGERLHERLTSENERIERSSWDGLFLVHRPQYYRTAEYMEILDRLETLTCIGEATDIVDALSDFVPKFGDRLPKSGTKTALPATA